CDRSRAARDRSRTRRRQDVAAAERLRRRDRRRRGSPRRGYRGRVRRRWSRRGRDGPNVRGSNGGVKTKRQQAILSLVARERLGSQHEIISRLAELGLDVTQSTISRGIEELGLAPV